MSNPRNERWRGSPIFLHVRELKKKITQHKNEAFRRDRPVTEYEPDDFQPTHYHEELAALENIVSLESQTESQEAKDRDPRLVARAKRNIMRNSRSVRLRSLLSMGDAASPSQRAELSNLYQQIIDLDRQETVALLGYLEDVEATLVTTGRSSVDEGLVEINLRFRRKNDPSFMEESKDTDGGPGSEASDAQGEKRPTVTFANDLPVEESDQWESPAKDEAAIERNKVVGAGVTPEHKDTVATETSHEAARATAETSAGVDVDHAAAYHPRPQPFEPPSPQVQSVVPVQATDMRIGPYRDESDGSAEDGPMSKQALGIINEHRIRSTSPMFSPSQEGSMSSKSNTKHSLFMGVHADADDDDDIRMGERLAACLPVCFAQSPVKDSPAKKQEKEKRQRKVSQSGRRNLIRDFLNLQREKKSKAKPPAVTRRPRTPSPAATPEAVSAGSAVDKDTQVRRSLGPVEAPLEERREPGRVAEWWLGYLIPDRSYKDRDVAVLHRLALLKQAYASFTEEEARERHKEDPPSQERSHAHQMESMAIERMQESAIIARMEADLIVFQLDSTSRAGVSVKAHVDKLVQMKLKLASRHQKLHAGPGVVSGESCVMAPYLDTPEASGICDALSRLYLRTMLVTQNDVAKGFAMVNEIMWFLRDEIEECWVRVKETEAKIMMLFKPEYDNADDGQQTPGGDDARLQQYEDKLRRLKETLCDKERLLRVLKGDEGGESRLSRKNSFAALRQINRAMGSVDVEQEKYFVVSIRNMVDNTLEDQREEENELEVELLGKASGGSTATSQCAEIRTLIRSMPFNITPEFGPSSRKSGRDFVGDMDRSIESATHYAAVLQSTASDAACEIMMCVCRGGKNGGGKCNNVYSHPADHISAAVDRVAQAARKAHVGVMLLEEDGMLSTEMPRDRRDWAKSCVDPNSDVPLETMIQSDVQLVKHSDHVLLKQQLKALEKKLAAMTSTLEEEVIEMRQEQRRAQTMQADISSRVVELAGLEEETERLEEEIGILDSEADYSARMLKFLYTQEARLGEEKMLYSRHIDETRGRFGIGISDTTHRMREGAVNLLANLYKYRGAIQLNQAPNPAISKFQNVHVSLSDQLAAVIDVNGQLEVDLARRRNMLWVLVARHAVLRIRHEQSHFLVDRLTYNARMLGLQRDVLGELVGGLGFAVRPAIRRRSSSLRREDIAADIELDLRWRQTWQKPVNPEEIRALKTEAIRLMNESLPAASARLEEQEGRNQRVLEALARAHRSHAETKAAIDDSSEELESMRDTIRGMNGDCTRMEERRVVLQSLTALCSELASLSVRCTRLSERSGTLLVEVDELMAEVDEAEEDVARLRLLSQEWRSIIEFNPHILLRQNRLTQPLDTLVRCIDDFEAAQLALKKEHLKSIYLEFATDTDIFHKEEALRKELEDEHTLRNQAIAKMRVEASSLKEQEHALHVELREREREFEVMSDPLTLEELRAELLRMSLELEDLMEGDVQE